MMQRNRNAFTLVEVLISIALLGLILPALYQSVDLLRDSNHQLKEYLIESKKETKASKTLYLDIASSDGNLTLRDGEFDRVCMEQTRNSLYGLASAKVCWVVLKNDHTLVRVEGSSYNLPVGLDERVEVDLIMRDVTLFDVQREKGKVLVLLQQKSHEPVAFLVEGVTKPKPKKKKMLKNAKKKKKSTSSTDTNTTTPAPSPSPSPAPTP